MQRLISLYQHHFGCELEQIVELAGAGSARRYFRLSSVEAGSAIGTIGPDARENETFIRLSDIFGNAGLPVPRVYCSTPDKTAYLQTDLGDTSLFSILGTPEGEALVEKYMTLLPELQTLPGLTPDTFYPVERMEPIHVMRDLNYFKYCFLKGAGIEPDENALDRDFMHLASLMTDTPSELLGVVLRDCQSRNVMVHEGKPWFIDFQSARRGPVMYDVASFLWQARARFSPEFRRSMTHIYMKQLSRLRNASTEAMKQSLTLMVWLRTLQVLGAYGLRGLTQRKAHFLASLPAAMDNVRQLLDSPDFTELTELRRCLRLAEEQERFKLSAEQKLLTVSIFSFSYKAGYPDDFSGNGGGFMFDCRAMHNPGRYDRYKPLTGRDLPVIEFLEEQGEVQPFLQAAAALVEPAVRRYVKRGFTSLQVGFGCTGGRHRSVYCAEQMARILREHFSPAEVRILLHHREQHISTEL